MKRFSILILLGAAVIFAGCGGSDPVGKSASVPYPQNVAITIGSADVTDTSIMPGMGSSTIYRARPTSVPPGLTVRVHYQGPMGMMNNSGDWMMYDDGTHGDRTPGDGEYCYQDFDQMRIHMRNAMPGHYTFDFYCVDSNGNHSPYNTAWVDVD